MTVQIEFKLNLLFVLIAILIFNITNKKFKLNINEALRIRIFKQHKTDVLIREYYNEKKKNSPKKILRFANGL